MVQEHTFEPIPENLSIYEYMEQCAQAFMDYTAISFYGIKFTYKEMLDKIDEVAKALIAMGVKKDDIVAASLPGTPEGVFLIYAINKIGAIYCAFDCRCKADEIKDTIKNFSPKVCVVPSFQLKEFRDVTECPVVCVSPIHTIPFMGKFHATFSNFFTGRDFVRMKNRSIIMYDRFIKGGKNVGAYPTATATNDIFGYFYTSGTTYGRKSVILTNRNLNAAVTIQKISNAHVGITPGESLLNIMPLFTCYSVTLAMHLPLICGVYVNLIPLVDVKKMKQVIVKQKPNYIITVPAHWEYFVKESYDGCDLSFMKLIIVGGDTMHPEFRNKLNGIFQSHGGRKPLLFGYGLTETASTTCSACTVCPERSVGRELPYIQIGILDHKTGKMLPAGQEGEICICSPTVCKGYYNDQKMTDLLLHKHEDGKIWLHSGDRGYLDETGALFFCERFKRMYVRFDGTKVSPLSIEEVLQGCPVVDQVLVSVIPDTDHSHGKCPKAYIVPKDGIKEKAALAAVQKYAKQNLDEHMQLKQIVITEHLPRTKNGKLRYFE